MKKFWQLTFKDINGLVEQNVQLRSLVRNLSDQIESREMEFKVSQKLLSCLYSLLDFIDQLVKDDMLY